ncbi:MAG: hypothetical protein IJK07_08745 [Bacteroidales bacterium]|nr:hypothetical protein [Bacteroidales bacterium]
MKRTVTIVLSLIAFLLVLASLAVSVKRHANVSEVYRRYKDRDNLSVAFVKDYRIGDSITVDVTTITAPDSASWENLQREMNQSENMIKRRRELANEGRYQLANYYCEIGHPEHHITYDEGRCWLVFLNFTEKTIYIFHITSHEQAFKIQESKIKEIYNNA